MFRSEAFAVVDGAPGARHTVAVSFLGADQCALGQQFAETVLSHPFEIAGAKVANVAVVKTNDIAAADDRDDQLLSITVEVTLAKEPA